MKCISGCYKCCLDTEMILSEEDIERICKRGYDVDKFVVFKGGHPRLRNIDGHCVFLDINTGKCKIYYRRPIGCRVYPVIYHPKIGFKIDELCPARSTLSIKEFIGRVEALKYLLKKIEYKYR